MALQSDHRALMRPPGRIKAALLGMFAGWYGRQVILGDPFDRIMSGGSGFAGERVSVNSMLQLGTVWACVRLISETISTLPLGMFRSQENGTREAYNSHNLYPLLHHQPNADMTAMTFWQAFVASMLLWGAAYVEKVMTVRGVVVSFEFLLPGCVSRVVEGNAMVWKYADPVTGTSRTIPDDRMWATPAFSLDGYTGLSPVAYGAHVFGGVMAAERAAADTFKNGMKSPGLVTIDAVLKPGQRDEIREHVRKVSAEGGVMVFEKGGSFSALAMNPEDAQLLATRDYGVELICSWFLVPPHMIGHTAKSTSWGTGIEQQMLGFLAFALRPWCVRIEQSIRKNLLSAVDRQAMTAEFAIEGLLRGDSAAQAALFASAGQNGWMTRNEIRGLKNLPPMPGGDVLTVQSNLVPIEKLGQTPPAPTVVPPAAHAALANLLKPWPGPFDPKETT